MLKRNGIGVNKTKGDSEIIYLMLKLCDESKILTRKSHMLHKVNLGTAQLERYLGYALEKDLLERKGKGIDITDKGIEYIDKYDEFINVLS